MDTLPKDVTLVRCHKNRQIFCPLMFLIQDPWIMVAFWNKFASGVGPRGFEEALAPSWEELRSHRLLNKPTPTRSNIADSCSEIKEGSNMELHGAKAHFGVISRSR